MSYGDCPDTITNLPPEVLKHILSNLSYPYLQSIRPTCRAFNVAATDILREGLHSIRLRVDNAATKYLKARWLKTDHAGDELVLTYAKRLVKGSGSLVILAGLIRAADVCSRHLVRVGALPPLPGTVLEEILAAVNMGSRRNPLVGINRLQHIYRNLLAYFRRNGVLGARELPPTVLYQTVLDVLQNMPRLATSDRLEHTEQGIRLSCSLPPIRVNLQLSGKGHLSRRKSILVEFTSVDNPVISKPTLF